MSEQTNERLSALVDGELADHERQQAIDALLNDAEARGRWERQHLISDALRRNLPPLIDRGLADSVMQALQSEPAILAPRRRDNTLFTRRVAGFAVAASVAVIGVLGVQFMYRNDGLVPTAIDVAELPAQNSPVANAPSGGVQLVDETDTPQIDPRVQQNLAKYLLDHNQQASRAVQGAIPYARIVTYPGNGPGDGASQQDQNQGQQ